MVRASHETSCLVFRHWAVKAMVHSNQYPAMMMSLESGDTWCANSFSAMYTSFGSSSRNSYFIVGAMVFEVMLTMSKHTFLSIFVAASAGFFREVTITTTSSVKSSLISGAFLALSSVPLVA